MPKSGPAADMRRLYVKLEKIRTQVEELQDATKDLRQSYDLKEYLTEALHRAIINLEYASSAAEQLSTTIHNDIHDVKSDM